MPNLEQLKMIQAVTARMAGNSFLLKGWTVTLVAGLTAFARLDSDRSFALIAVFVIAVLGLLDAYYLALERAYRALYATEASKPDDAAWSISAGRVGARQVLSAFFSVSVAPLYLVALVVAIAVVMSA